MALLGAPLDARTARPERRGDGRARLRRQPAAASATATARATAVPAAGHQLRLPAHRAVRHALRWSTTSACTRRASLDHRGLRHRPARWRPARRSRWPSGRDDWIAIWWLGELAWFKGTNAAGDVRGAAVAGHGRADGRRTPSVPVYGRGLPGAGGLHGHAGALPDGRRRCSTASSPASPTCSPTTRCGPTTTTRRPTTRRCPGTTPSWSGKQRYYQIWFGHRIAYVKADRREARRRLTTPDTARTRPRRHRRRGLVVCGVSRRSGRPRCAARSRSRASPARPRSRRRARRGRGRPRWCRRRR